MQPGPDLLQGIASIRGRPVEIGLSSGSARSRRPGMDRVSEPSLHGRRTVTGWVERPQCDAVDPAGNRCILEAGHAGRHGLAAPRSGLLAAIVVAAVVLLVSRPGCSPWRNAHPVICLADGVLFLAFALPGLLLPGYVWAEPWLMLHGNRHRQIQKG
jgi:hypothetical protein